MKKWNWNTAFFLSSLVALLCLARIAVSIGRLIYSIQTGNPLTDGGPLPTWYSLLLEDGFFYIGIAALIFSAVCAYQSKKKEK